VKIATIGICMLVDYSVWLIDCQHIHIPTKSSSNEIKSFVVVFIPLQLMLGSVVEHRWDHVFVLYDLPNSTILARKIVASSVLTITKILAIEDHKLYDTFLHVAFGSQSLLNPTSDQTGSDNN
jgi:L-rhamnose isomerase